MARWGRREDGLSSALRGFVPDLVRVNDEGAFVRRSASLERLPAPALDAAGAGRCRLGCRPRCCRSGT